MFEIISNSIDEAREGYGKRIIITLHEDKSITVEDFGRGIPIDFNKSEDKYNWELAFCTLYAGSKYNNNSGGNYSFALGLNGLGLCATQFSSEYMEVESRRGQWKYSLRFEKGFNVTQDERGFKKSRGDGTTGTYGEDESLDAWVKGYLALEYNNIGAHAKRVQSIFGQ